MDRQTEKEIKEAFLQGQLKIRSVNNETSEVAYEVISDVMKHHTPHKRILKVILDNGEHVVATEDHSLFVLKESKIVSVTTDSFSVGGKLVIVKENCVEECLITSISEQPNCEFTYDLCVPKNENFVLANGILAHNSYSIGGISLDLERSSKYEMLRAGAEAQVDRATEMKQRTTKFIRGLVQPRYGIGIRSSFGPHVGQGVLSPRGFIG